MIGTIKRARKLEGYHPSDDSSVELFGAHVSAPQVITPSTAETLSAVWNAIVVLSQGVSRLPLIVYRRLAGGGKSRASSNVVYELFHRAPNSMMTPFEFKECIMGHLLLRGDFFALKWINTKGEIELIPMHPDRMQVSANPRTGLSYEYNDPENGFLKFGQDEVFHVKGLRSDGLRGKSIIEVGRIGLQRVAYADSYATEFFQNSATPLGILKYPRPLDDEMFARLKQDWEDKHKGPENRHKIAILEEGLDWQQLGISNSDSQFIESRQFEISEVARWFNVPPHKLKDLSRSTYSNIESQSREFHEDSILPWCQRIAEHVNRSFFRIQRTLFAEFLYDSILITDTLARYQAHNIALQGGWKTRNEIREIENLNPDPDLDEFLIPLNMGNASDMQMTTPDDTPPEPVVDTPTEQELNSVQLDRVFRRVLKECFERCVTAEVKSIERAARATNPAQKLDTLYEDFPEKLKLMTDVMLGALAESFAVVEDRAFIESVRNDWLNRSHERLIPMLQVDTWRSELEEQLKAWSLTRAAHEVEYCMEKVRTWNGEIRKAA